MDEQDGFHQVSISLSNRYILSDSDIWHHATSICCSDRAGSWPDRRSAAGKLCLLRPRYVLPGPDTAHGATRGW